MAFGQPKSPAEGFDMDIWLLPFSGDTKIQVSVDGGWEPVWTPDGGELYYRGLTGDKVMVVSVDSQQGFQVGTPTLLFEGPYEANGYCLGRSYDLTPDGRRFLMIAGPTELSATPAELKIMVNWFSELQASVPR